MTYQELYRMNTCVPFPCNAQNEEGETIIMQQINQDGETVFKVSTLQNNGWIRVNYYYKDDTIEEIYEK